MAKRRKSPRAARAESRAAWRIHFFLRHAADDPSRAVPARDFLEQCPVAARFAAVLKAVAEAPPHAFAGGGYWEAMHGTMAGLRVPAHADRRFRSKPITDSGASRSLNA